MRLLRISLADFRNIERAELVLSPRVTVVVGANGQGKTNFLESAFLLCTLRPLRAARFAELIRFGREKAHLEGLFELGGAERSIAVVLHPKGRQAFVDGKGTRSLEDYFVGLSVVAFTPDDLAIVKGSPEGRRRFLDRAVFNRFPSYLKESREYQRALKSRNQLLRSGAAPDLLDAYSETCALGGARLLVRRRALLKELSPRAQASFRAIAPGDGEAELVYRFAQLPEGMAEAPEAELATALLEALRRRTALDVERGYTSVGPHADDLELRIGDRPAKLFASQGQQRALVLALKIGEIDNLKQALSRSPLLLLDDVSSELDPQRNAFLMGYLFNSEAQVLLNTTDMRLVQGALDPEAVLLSVSGGSFSRLAAP